MGTRCVHAGERGHTDKGAVCVPIYHSSSFHTPSLLALEQARSGERPFYSRYGNPTVEALEEKVADLEGAPAGVAFSSGMGAISTTLLSLLHPGERVIASLGLYGGTTHLLQEVLAPLGIEVVTFSDLAQLRVLGREGASVLYLESPINPTLRLVDLSAAAKAVPKATVVVDNTFATPINQRPLELGAHVVVHSATKYLGGHSDLLAGVAVGDRRRMKAIRERRKLLGPMLDPMTAFLALRGLKTLHLRMERHNASAAAVAKEIEGARGIRAVSYPGLRSHPQHRLAARQMDGYGGIVTLTLRDLRAVERFVARLRVITHAATVAGHETLATIPALTSHWNLPPARLAAEGVKSGMVRISIGLEEPADLVADLRQALAANR